MRLCPFDWAPPNPSDLLGGSEDEVFPLLLREGHACISDGADVICLGSTTMHQAHAYLSEHLPIPVINPGPLTYKLIELMLSLGLSHSKTAYPKPDTVESRAPSRHARRRCCLSNGGTGGMASPTPRAYLEDGQSHLIVGVYDVLTAKTAVASEFEILYVGGYGTAAGVFGLPDLGITTMTEMVDTCSRICDAVDRPILVDADTGYGNTLNTRRAVRAFERSGASGLHLEDQTFPKRCGHFAGKTLISSDEMCQKIRVALDARQSEEFVIIARSDAVAVEGVDEAIRRGLAYHDAGADVLFIDAPESVDEAARIARELPGPLLFDWSYDQV